MNGSDFKQSDWKYQTVLPHDNGVWGDLPLSAIEYFNTSVLGSK